ncbi:YadA-like family protein [Dryocola clanedunensis]|uniref:YadA-like family protein n=1 Tax=Cedecea sulfonylureivorans TaxID=3051154 RepID=UPI001F1E645B|nr:YadA-like family protein [Cedecea sulfonylureivorans]
MNRRKIAFALLAIFSGTTTVHAAENSINTDTMNATIQDVQNALNNNYDYYHAREAVISRLGYSYSEADKFVTDVREARISKTTTQAQGLTTPQVSLLIAQEPDLPISSSDSPYRAMGQTHHYADLDDLKAQAKAGDQFAQEQLDKYVKAETAARHGAELTAANQARTAAQTDAEHGAELTAANQARTGTQTDAEHGAELTAANRARTAAQINAEHGAELTAANQARTAAQTDAEHGAELTAANQARTSPQVLSTQTELNHSENTSNRSLINQNTASISTFKEDVKQAKTTSITAQSRADAAYTYAEKNHQSLSETNKRLVNAESKEALNEQHIGTLESQTTSNFAKLKSQVDDNRKRASAGISGVAAMANIPQVTNTQDFSVGAGVGTADSESALAVGFSARATENVVVKASVSDDSQHNFVTGAGVSYGW